MAPKKYLFRKARKTSNPAHVLVLMILVASFLLVNQALARGSIEPLFLPTPTATRHVNSYLLEARTHFDAGNLGASITAFEQALQVEPNNSSLYVELARVLAYSSEMVTTDTERQERLEAAVENARKAVELNDESSDAHAMLAFTLDFYSSFVSYTLLEPERGEDLLLEAEQEISRARVLDETNLNALIYYAEIQTDRMRFDQAESALRQVLETAPDLWEAHRVNGIFLEYQGRYKDSVAAFEEAVRLAPNMTFLYIKLGQSNRNLGLRYPFNPPSENPYFNKALEYFSKAANLNEQLGIADPYPYLGIGYTYSQMGEFFIATRNMEKALSLNPNSPKVYGDLGMVARQGNNYELAIDALGCAVEGCGPVQSCRVRNCDEEVEAPITISRMDLNPNTVAYYFTYASLLAGMHLPNHPTRETYCEKALDVIDQVMAVPLFANEPIYVSILEEGEAICETYGYRR